MSQKQRGSGTYSERSEGQPMPRIPTPVTQTVETVTLSRADWDVMIESLYEAQSPQLRDPDGHSPLQDWRDYRGLSLETLAARTGIAEPVLRQIEAGALRASADMLIRLARTLRVTVDDLMPDAT